MPEDLDSIHVDLDVPEPPASTGSVDVLLAMTEETDDWSADDELDELKRAALGERRVPRPKARTEKLLLPTPYEFNPIPIQEARISRPPPPLPARSSQPLLQRSVPPPLPRKSAPPPLPKRESDPPQRAKNQSNPDLQISEEMGDPIVADRRSGPPPLRAASTIDALPDLLTARAAILADKNDKVGLARIHIEHAAISEVILGDDAREVAQAELALKLDPRLGVAHAILRRRKHSRTSLGAILTHLDHELLSTTTEGANVHLLAERARVSEAAGEIPSVVRELWERALAHAPEHPAALKGLEGALLREASMTRREDKEAYTAAWQRVADHLGKIADAYAGQPALAAWLHAERAWFFEWRLGDVRAARSSLERALELMPAVGPIRTLALRHVAAHGDALAIAVLLEEEASLETDAPRAARLELDAATVIAEKLGDPKRASVLLERAALRAPTTTSIDRRVLDQLVHLYEAQSMWAEAARTRRARLRFLSQPQIISHELRVLARIAERLEDLDKAVVDVKAALELDPEDENLLDMLDRLLKECGQDNERLSLWLKEATRRKEPDARAKAFMIAAEISEGALSNREEAVRHLRAAWTAAPGDAAVFERLSHLLAPPLREDLPGDARGLADLYAQAASLEIDRDQKLAHLGKLALIWEEMIGDSGAASTTYEEILAISPDDRAAILGLVRTAARTGDSKKTARALLDQARLSSDAKALDLTVRAAKELSSHDPARALSLIEDVLGKDRQHRTARTLETRLHEEAGRWERAALSLKARIDGAANEKEKIELLLDLAQIQDLKLRSPSDALRSLESAARINPLHPVPREEILRMLEAKGDFVSLRESMETLAQDAMPGEERLRYLIRAAEIDEWRLGNDERAAMTYARALAETPDDDFVSDRLERVLLRRAATEAKGGSTNAPSGFAEVDALWSKRLERATLPSTLCRLALDLAQIGLELGKDSSHLKGLLESALVDAPSSIPALRLLEFVTRQASDIPHLARTLSRQGDVFEDPRAALGALYELNAIEDWKVTATDPAATCERILRLTARDPIILERAIQHALPAARKGAQPAVQRATAHLRSLVAYAHDDGVRHEAQLRLALLLERSSEMSDGAAHVKEAVERYSAALHLDPLSVVAASGLARTATRANDTDGMIDAALSLADLAGNGAARGRYFLDAADLLVADGRGSSHDRRTRAAELLEKAIDADPDFLDAITKLALLRQEEHHPTRLVEPFRRALERATDRQAILELGQTLARTAKEDLRDFPLAMNAIKKCREVAPNDVAVLLTLSEISIAQGLWPEAMNALTQIVEHGGESRHKLTALFALANIFAHVLDKEAEAEKMLRRALTINPRHPRALRTLLRAIDAKGNGRSDEAASLLEELALVEPDPSLRADYLVRAADTREGLNNREQAEKALIEVVAFAPERIECFERLLAFYKRSSGEHDEQGLARALGAVIARGQELGHHEARWHFALGRLEIESLGRYHEAVGHFERALELNPQSNEAYAQLLVALAKSGRTGDACRVGLALFDGDSRRFRGISDPERTLRILEDSLATERRTEEAVVVAELRAFAGSADETRLRWLRSRHLGALEPHHSQLDRPALVTHVLPPEGRHVLLEVAAAVAGLESRVFRTDLADLGITAKDRIHSRSGHPTRVLMDRLCRSLGLSDLELVVSPNVHRTRVIAHDTLWVIVPRGVADMPEAAQLATLARALTRISLGVPWLEELPPGQIEAFLIACGRQVVHGYGADDIDILATKLVPTFEAAVQKHLGRKQRKILEELAAHLTVESGRPLPIDFFIQALARAELRAAYLLTGNLLATIDELRSSDAELGGRTDVPSRETLQRLLAHPLAADTCRYALSPEAHALRRRIGTQWG